MFHQCHEVPHHRSEGKELCWKHPTCYSYAQALLSYLVKVIYRGNVVSTWNSRLRKRISEIHTKSTATIIITRAGIATNALDPVNAFPTQPTARISAPVCVLRIFFAWA